ncbi:MAG: hypothetical protein WEC58_02045, partial [Candidatus Paceibacterota bacterium]
QNQFTVIVDQILESLNNVWLTFLDYLPEVLSALFVFILGLIIASFLGSLTQKLLSLAKIDELSERSGLTDMMRRSQLNFTFSWLIGKVVKWFFIIVFLLAAADILGWEEVTSFLREILFYIPNVIVAIIILAVGMIAGNFLGRLISSGATATRLPVKNTALLGTIAKVAVITFATLAALLQLGIAESLIEILFAGLVLAVALAFGLGGQSKASEILERLDTTTGSHQGGHAGDQQRHH